MWCEVCILSSIWAQSSGPIVCGHVAINTRTQCGVYYLRAPSQYACQLFTQLRMSQSGTFWCATGENINQCTDNVFLIAKTSFMNTKHVEIYYLFCIFSSIFLQVTHIRWIFDLYLILFVWNMIILSTKKYMVSVFFVTVLWNLTWNGIQDYFLSLSE